MLLKRLVLSAGLVLGLAAMTLLTGNADPLTRQVSASGPAAGTREGSQAGKRNSPLASGIADGGFELGDAGPWTQFSTLPGPPIIVSAGFLAPEGVTPHTGEYAAWLGAAPGDTSYVSQTVTIDAAEPTLVFWNWLKPAAEACSGNSGSVLVDDSPVTSFSLCSPTEGWERKALDLSGFAGRTVRIEFRAVTSDSPASFFLDDVSLGAPSGEPTQTPTPTPGATPTPTATPIVERPLYLPLVIRGG